jgi:Domain of unknown function (DUF4190)
MSDGTGRPDESGTSPWQPPSAAPPPAPGESLPAAPPPPPPPPGYGAPPAAYGAPQQLGAYGPAPTNGKAIASMVLGIVGLVGICLYGLGVIASILAVVFGFLAKKEIRNSGGAQGGAGMATAGLVTGWIGIALAIVVVIFIVIAVVVGASNSSPSVGY